MLRAILITVALKADRGWPFLLAGLHLTTLGAHAVRMIEPSMIQVTYAVMLSMWSYPMVIALTIGTWRHRNRIEARGFAVTEREEKRLELRPLIRIRIAFFVLKKKKNILHVVNLVN